MRPCQFLIDKGFFADLYESYPSPSDRDLVPGEGAATDLAMNRTLSFGLGCHTLPARTSSCSGCESQGGAMGDAERGSERAGSEGPTSEDVDRLSHYAGVTLDAALSAFVAGQLEQSLPLLRRIRPAGYEWLSPVVAIRLPEDQ
jgi:hypothetical protein